MRRAWLRLGVGSLLALLVGTAVARPVPATAATSPGAIDCIKNYCAGVAVRYEGNGSGVVNAGPLRQIHCSVNAGVNVGGTCSAVFSWSKSDSIYDLTWSAVPAVGSMFCTLQPPACDPEGNSAAQTIELAPGDSVGLEESFELAQRTLTVTLAGAGSGVVTSRPAGLDCPGTCRISPDYGTAVVLTAVAQAGSHFAGWGGACTGTKATCSITLTDSATASADFEPGPPTPTPPPAHATPPPAQPTPSPASPSPAPTGSILAMPTVSPAPPATVAPSAGAPAAATDTGVPPGIVALLVVLALACGGLLVAVLALLRRGRSQT